MAAEAKFMRSDETKTRILGAARRRFSAEGYERTTTLPAGSAVTGSIVTGGTAGGFTVPSEAVQTVEGASVVFVRTATGFRVAPVLVGRQAGDRTEILSGLTGAERIAGANAFLLKAELAKGEAEHGH